MTLQQQEVQEPSASEVVRLAQQMYERDRAEKERQTNLAAAAEEMGIPAEYLTKATAHLKARQVVAHPLQTRRSPTAMLIAALISAAIALLLGFFLTYAYSGSSVVTPAPPPPTVVQPMPVKPMPSPTNSMPVTEPAQPYPAPPSGPIGN